MSTTLTPARHLLTATTLTLFAASALPGCNSTPDPSAPPASRSSTPTSQPVGAHWIHDQHLREIMARLSQQTPSLPPGTPAARPTPDDFDAVSLLAAELSASADRLPALAKSLPMHEADRAGFTAEAHTLRDQATRLHDAARHQRLDQMRLDLNSIHATCLSCHSRYRDFSGQLNTTQTSLPPAPHPRTPRLAASPGDARFLLRHAPM